MTRLLDIFVEYRMSAVIRVNLISSEYLTELRSHWILQRVQDGVHPVTFIPIVVIVHQDELDALLYAEAICITISSVQLFHQIFFTKLKSSKTESTLTIL